MALSASGSLTDKEVILSGTVDGQTASWVARVERSEGVVDELNRSQYIVARVADPYGLADRQHQYQHAAAGWYLCQSLH